MVEPGGLKNDYRALIRYLSGALIIIILAVFGYVVSAQVKLVEKVDCKVDKTRYLEDKMDIKDRIKEVDLEVKAFRGEVRKDMDEIKILIKEVRN